MAKPTGRRHDRSWFGYKNHINADVEHGFNRGADRPKGAAREDWRALTVENDFLQGVGLISAYPE